MHCGAANGQKGIVSQRVMGLLDAECATKCVETPIHGKERARILASQGKVLLTSCGVIKSPRPSAHQAPLSASKSIVDFDPTLDSQKVYPKSLYKEQHFETKKVMFEISPQTHSYNHDLLVTSASSSGATISNCHHNGDACHFISNEQETTAISLSSIANSSINDAHSAQSGVIIAQCVEKQDLNLPNNHDTRDDYLLAASSNFIGTTMPCSSAPAR